MRPDATGDEPHYALAAISLARDGDWDLANQYRNPRLLRAVAGGTALLPHASRHGGRLVPTHSIGLPLLLAPVALLTTDVVWMRLVVLVIAAFGAALLLRLVRRLDGSWRGWLAWALVAFSLPVLAYSAQLYPEMPAAVCVLLAANAALAGPRSRIGWLGGVAGLAFLPWLQPRFLPIVAGGAIALACAARRHRGRRPAPGVMAMLVLPLACSFALLGWANEAWYGSASPAAAGRSSGALPTARPPGTAGHGHASGGAATAYADLDGGLIYINVVRRILSPGTGWLAFAPVFVLALAGFLALLALHRRAAAIVALLAVPYLLLMLVRPETDGFAFPGRYLVALGPLAAVPLVAALRVRPAVPPAVALGALTAAVTFAGVIDHTALLGGREDVASSVPVVHQYASVWPVAPLRSLPATAIRFGAGRLRRSPGATSTAPVGLRRGSYTAAFTVAGGASARGSARLEIRSAGGRLVTAQPVTAGELLGRRTFLVAFRAAGPVRVALGMRGAPGLRLASAQIASDPRLARSARTYSQWPKVAAWLLAIAALGLALARGAPGRPGRAARVPGASNRRDLDDPRALRLLG